MGRVEGGEMTSGTLYHGILTAMANCIRTIPAKLGVRSIRGRAHNMIIWTGSREGRSEADPRLPPLEDPHGAACRTTCYKANWLLIVDNLSDFAHLAFVHTNTLGGSEEYAYKTKPVAIEAGDGFRVERWHAWAPCAALP